MENTAPAIKQPRFKLGIRQKVLMVLLSVLLTAITVSGWMALEQEKENVLQEINQRGADITRFVAKSLAFSVIGYDYHMIQLLLDDITSSDEVQYAEVTNMKDKVMSKAGNYDTVRSDHLVIFTEDILLDEEKVGRLLISLSTVKVTERLESQKFFLVTREAIIILCIALGEFLALSYIIINPVNIISKALDSSFTDSGKLVSEIPIKSNDEFGRLATKFNDLGSQLNEANQKLVDKIDLADNKLIKTNEQLMTQSTELQRMNEEFKLMAITDAMTGLFNRRHFEDLINIEVDMSRRHGDVNSMLLIDIDFFKNINDTYGHFTGDTVLKLVSKVLGEQLRKTDVLCRVGGEEFVALCKRADKINLKIVADKLNLAIETLLISIGQENISVTVSIGGATIPGNEVNISVDEFYRQADKALYYCKENGRNQYKHFDDIIERRDQFT